MDDITEDIKILEEMITWDCLLPNKRQTEALENLIKGYRELEKRIIYLTNLLCINDSDKNYIPKSKIKEKIEELDKQRIKMVQDDVGVGFTLGNEWSDLKAKIQVLQELMEDK